MSNTTSKIESGKSKAIVAYLTIIGCIIAMFMNNEAKNKFASFHIKQALGIHIIYFLTMAIANGFNDVESEFVFLSIFSSFLLFNFILWGYSFIGALQGKKNLLPFIGVYFQKWFNKIA